MDNLKILRRLDQSIEKLKKDSLLLEQYPDCYTHKNPSKRLLSFVIHGNETIGLNILEELLENFEASPFSFIIANREAVKKNKRFVDSDLNRSFMTKNQNGFEQKHVKNIELFSKSFDYILDFHQTTHDSETPFCLVRSSDKSNALYKRLEKSLPFPIIYIQNQNLSKDGTTFSEFATQNDIGFITLELSKAGFSLEMKNLGFKISQSFLNAQNFSPMPSKSFNVFNISQSIEKINHDDHLLDGFNNFTKVDKKTVIAIREKKKISFDTDYYILFPKYNEYRKYSNELCKLMKRETIIF